MIEEAGPVLRPTQQAVAEETVRVTRQIGAAIHHRDRGTGM